MAVIKITTSSVDKMQLISPESNPKQILYFDSDMKGFGILVSQKTKTYVAQRDVKGKSVRVTLGRHGVLTTHDARGMAQQALAQMAAGNNPNQEKKRERANSITLSDALEEYLSELDNPSPLTVKLYRTSLSNHLSDWLKKPLRDITRDDVFCRHKKIRQKDGKKNGNSAANSVFRVFRAVYNGVLKHHEDLPANPTIAIKFHPDKQEKMVIDFKDIGSWYKQVMEISNPIRRDYLRFVLFTGLRRESAATLRWDDVDFENSTVRIIKPKGGKKRAFTLPMSDFLMDILKDRKDKNETDYTRSPFVFPANTKAGYLTEPKVELGIPFNIHSLRRFYISAAQATGIQLFDIKFLTNHSLPSEDVTAGYISPSVDSLRNQQNRITTYLLRLIEGAQN